MRTSVFLSILIPVYNWDIGELLKKLSHQAEVVHDTYPIEILAIDDGSDEFYNIESVENSLPLVKYESFSANRGRVAVRNDLIQRANGSYILFLDADMLPDSDNFLQCYIEMAKSGNDIICGGISYQQVTEIDEEYAFYLYKSKKTEAVSASDRNQTPWRYLFTSNIMLRREIVKEVMFDHRFSGYGFEDVEWAIRLAASYSIIHVDNSCTHMGLMKKKQVLSRMSDSIDNYALLLHLHPRETAGSPASKAIKFLKILPDKILHGADIVLEKLFFFFPWNFAAFVVFQCKKMVLLTIKIKNEKVSENT